MEAVQGEAEDVVAEASEEEPEVEGARGAHREGHPAGAASNEGEHVVAADRAVKLRAKQEVLIREFNHIQESSSVAALSAFGRACSSQYQHRWS